MPRNAVKSLTAVSFLSALLLAAGLADPARADRFEEGAAAYMRGHYSTARQKWRPLAEDGHANAQFALGALHERANGVPQDYAEAARWYRLAGDQGHASAQFNLGVAYSYGRGVEKSDAEALEWFLRAARQGLAKAQLQVGVMYGVGVGASQDFLQAYTWLSLAAAQGSFDAEDWLRELADEMPPERIAEARALASEWSPSTE